MNKSETRIVGTGMSREEILRHSDALRNQVYNYISENEKIGLGDIVTKFKISRHQATCYIRYLISEKYIQLNGSRGRYAYYVSTHKKYEPIKSLEKYNMAVHKDEYIIPGARVFRLSDKRPEPMTPEQRKQKAKDRTKHCYGVRGSSMSMFESF